MEMQKRPLHFLLPLLGLVATFVIVTHGQNIPSQQQGQASTGAADRKRTIMGKYPMEFQGMYNYGMVGGYTGYPMGVMGYQKGISMGTVGYQKGIPMSTVGYQKGIPMGKVGYQPGMPVGVMGYQTGIPMGVMSYQTGMYPLGMQKGYLAGYQTGYGNYFPGGYPYGMMNQIRPMMSYQYGKGYLG